jgi:hypothetical protein
MLKQSAKRLQYLKLKVQIITDSFHAQRCVQNLWFSVLLRRVVWRLKTNVSEDHAASIFRVEVCDQGDA